MIGRATVFPVSILSLFFLAITFHSIGGEQVGVSKHTKIDHERIRVNNELAKKVDQDIAKLRDYGEEKDDETDYCTENPDEPEYNSIYPNDEDGTIT